MNEITNSEILDVIIGYAKERLFNKKTNITTELFIVSVIDFLGKNYGESYVSSDEYKKLFDTFRHYFPIQINECKVLRERLINSYHEKYTNNYLDSLYFEKCLYDLKKQARTQNYTQITADAVLTIILQKSSAYVELINPEKPETDDDSDRSFNENASTEKESKDEKPIDEPSTEDELPEDDYYYDYELEEYHKLDVIELTEKAKNINDELLKSIYGQDNAVNVFTSGYFRAELSSITDKFRSGPHATFLFAGPPGVGKTFLAQKAAKVLGLPFRRFDMSEYSDKEANLEFCGSDKVYKNSKAGNVTSFVSENPRCVILFDEIEKAHINVIHLFLQILDAGHIRDNYTDNTVSFKNAILIFTTNAGKQLYENSDSTDFSGLTRRVILKALQNDINNATGLPFFPAAICSRFASGNVVMFNYITAHNLREIAKKEVLRNSNNFEEEVGIKVRIDDLVYTSLLFAEGGAADARTVKNRAESFFDDELFELFRLLQSDNSSTRIKELKSINFQVDLPKDNSEIYDLFVNNETYEVLVFSSNETFKLCSSMSGETKFTNVQSIESAKNILNKKSISFILIDMSFKQTGNKKYLNIEDVNSKGRDFFWFIRENYSELPIYLLQTQEKQFNQEEKLSFLRQGVRGFITVSNEIDAFSKEISSINEQLHQHKSMAKLARENKLISYETAQLIKNNGKTAVIKLFDFELNTAIEAEDSRNILSNISKPDISFEQVIGAEDAKKELKYFVDYLKNPKKYLETGVNAPKGVLLYGPPGTGKTLLAKAMASESNVTFITAEGNQFVNKFQGEGRDRVKELFRTARKYAPSIIFIDEIDAIAKERRGGEYSSDTEITLTAILTEMDGFKSDTSKPVFVLAATNFDVEPGTAKSLDPALMRRFDRRIYIDLPKREERERYIQIKLSNNSTFSVSNEMISNIAIRSAGMSLSELESAIELSLRSAIRKGNNKVTDDIFEESFETYNSGESKKWNQSLLERVARHEAGHAFLCWHSGETPSYVTIVARANHGGYMQHGDNEEKTIYTKDELLSKIRTSLGGRAAELVYYGDKDGVSTGAAADLVTATNLARRIICTYGMDEDFGLSVIDSNEHLNAAFSSELRAAVNLILDNEMKTAKRLIENNKDTIDLLVDRLMIDNHLTGDEIIGIFEKSAKVK